MTYLSRVELNPRSIQVVRDLADPRELHRTVMRAFPDTDAREPRVTFGVLHRLEVDAGLPRLLAQSHVEPRWDVLPTGIVLRDESKSIDAAFDALKDGDALQFLLVANSTKKVKREGRLSARVELRTDDDRHAWLVARATRSGFDLAGSGPHDGVRIERLVRGTSRSKITVQAVRFQGRLIVRDVDRFRAALEAGIGPGKAYGCGLLSVRPG
jgi:CRISPR system Cascade subunit CasE